MVILGILLWALSEHMGLTATAITWEFGNQVEVRDGGWVFLALFWLCWSGSFAVVGVQVQDTGVMVRPRLDASAGCSGSSARDVKGSNLSFVFLTWVSDFRVRVGFYFS